MNARWAAILFGLVFIAVGILGFFPNPLVSETGLFKVNTMHNLVHLLSAAILFAGLANPNFGAANALRLLGIVYILVAVLGYFTHTLDFLAIDASDNILHAALAVVFLIAGFGLPKGDIVRTA
ncbi:MAG: DUF4383 domain-containing protein [Bauldia sp.]